MLKLLLSPVVPLAVNSATIVAVVVPVTTDSNNDGFTVFTSVSRARSMNSGLVILFYGLLIRDIAIQLVNSIIPISWCLCHHLKRFSANLIACLYPSQQSVRMIPTIVVKRQNQQSSVRHRFSGHKVPCLI